MNPLGWKSATYDLARAGGAGASMHGAADDLLRSVQTFRSAAMHGEGISPSVDALLVGDQLVASLGSTRRLYDDFLRTARSGEADAATLANDLDFIAGNLRVTSEIRGVPGQVVGHARSARTAAEHVVANLRQGIGPADDATHEAMWRLRDHLDQGWQELGIAKTQGDLRGITSVT